MAGDIFAFDLDRAEAVAGLRDQPHEIEQPRFILFNLLRDLVERKLAIAVGGLAFLD